MRSRLSLLAAVALLALVPLLSLPALNAAPAKTPPLSAAARIPLGLQAWGIPDAFQMGKPDALGLGAYDGRTRTARYRYELLTGKPAAEGVKRRDNFHGDTSWPPEFRAALSDYKSVADEYDRGHLFPAADARTQTQMDATFLLSNMAPQHKALNRGLWKQLEEWLRDAAEREDIAGIWVATVPLYAPDDLPEQGEPTETRITFRVAGPNHVPIPTHFAKVALVLGKRGDNPVALCAWVFANRARANARPSIPPAVPSISSSTGPASTSSPSCPTTSRRRWKPASKPPAPLAPASICNFHFPICNFQ